MRAWYYPCPSVHSSSRVLQGLRRRLVCRVGMRLFLMTDWRPGMLLISRAKKACVVPSCLHCGKSVTRFERENHFQERHQGPTCIVAVHCAAQHPAISVVQIPDDRLCMAACFIFGFLGRLGANLLFPERKSRLENVLFDAAANESRVRSHQQDVCRNPPRCSCCLDVHQVCQGEPPRERFGCNSVRV